MLAPLSVIWDRTNTASLIHYEYFHDLTLSNTVQHSTLRDQELLQTSSSASSAASAPSSSSC